jgi:DUF438 domain-containing protein
MKIAKKSKQFREMSMYGKNRRLDGQLEELLSNTSKFVFKEEKILLFIYKTICSPPSTKTHAKIRLSEYSIRSSNI